MVMEPEAIQEFTDIYEREFGIKLPEDEAKFKANKLMKLFRRAIFNQQKGENKK